MSEPALFGAVRYELAMPEGCAEALVVALLPEREARRLGEAFAGIDPWATYAYPASALAAYFASQEPGAPRFLLTLGGKVAGAVGVRMGWLRGPYIQFLGLLPKFQRRGLGSMVLAWVEHEARSAGERNLWVAASEINVDAIRFYERHGFAQVATLDDLVYDGRTEILLRKRLV
jgi:ribosomal protein S18 acetylase RimI-like enzyme